MEEDCKRCKEWEEHFYWDHLDVKRMRFSKIMIGDFSRRMSIPEKFIDNFRGKLPGVVDLKGPGGDIWRVGLVKDPYNTYLEYGWTKFVEDHHVVEDDILVFKYNRNSCFKVVMFDITGCEKASSYFAKNHGPKNRDKRDRSVEILNASPHRNVTELSSSSSSHDDTIQPSRIHNVGSRRDKRTRGNEHFFRQKITCGKTRENLGTSKGAKRQIKQESDESEDEKHTNATFYISYKTRLTDGEEKQAEKLVLEVQPGNPMFLSVMKPSYICKGFRLTIPCSFARRHLSTKYTSVRLRTPGLKQKWSARYLAYENISFLYGGWKNFAVDNNLEVGDVCLFELSEGGRKFAMTVHISRAADEAASSKQSYFPRPVGRVNHQTA